MKRFYYTLLLTLVGSTSYGQFSSSVCGAGALPIQCAPNTVNLTSGYTNSGIIDPETENGTGCSSVGSDITAGTIYDYDGWFTTTADASGLVEVYAAIISGDPVIGLYSGPCSSPTLLSCDDDGGAGLDAYISQSGLTPGGTYWVRIWDYNGGTGTYEVTTNGGTPPANDDCASADGLTVNGSAVSGTTYCATVETSDWNDCESNTENNVWYTFTTSYDGDITVNFSSIDCFGSGAGIDVSVFYGNCSSFTSYGCTSVSAGSTGSITQFTGPAGTYYVMVDGDNSGGATSLCDFDVDVDFSADPCSAAGGGAPANDDCSSATSLVENGAPVAGTVYCATVETSDYDDCEANTENNVWYTFTASGNGNVNVNVFPNNCFTSNDELDVSVFSGSCGSFVGVTCGTVGSTLNTISFNANSGTTYYIMVDGANDGTTTSNCDFDIDIDFSLVCPTPGYTDITNGGTLLSANNPYDCDDQFYLRADLIGAAGGVLAPGIDILVDGNTFDAYTNAEFSITVYQDYGSGYVSVIDWPVGTFPNGPVGTVYTLTNYFLDPTVPTMVEFCDAYGDGAVDYSIDDAVTGANITAWSTADFDAIPGTASSECVQIIIPANTMTATSTWTITPVVDPNAFITFPDGYAYVNTAYMTAGTYDITYIFDDGNGCYSTSTQTLEVGPAPTVVPVIDSLCGDGSGNGVFDLTSYNSTANGGTGNTVSWYDNTVTLIPTPGSYTVNSSSSPDTVYSIIEEATSLCLAAGLNQFVVTESPTVSIAPDPVDVCEGEDAAIVATGLGGTGFLTYAWTGTGAGNLDNTANPSPTFNSASTGTQSLTITATDNVGCTATDNISVNVYPVPATPTISTTPPSCSADGASTVTNYNSGYTYTFSPAGPSVGAGGSISGMTYGTSYTVVADNGNCTSSASSSFSISAMYITPIISSVTNPEVCADANSVDLGSLTPSVTNGVAGTGQWYVGNSNAGSTTSGTQSGLSNGDQFFYEYTATSGGCSDNVTITVTVNVLPNASAGSDVVIDCNSSGGQEVLDGSGSDAGMNYSWTTGTGNIVSGSGTTAPTVDAAGTYTITVLNTTTSCSATDDVVVTTDLIVPTASAGTDFVIDCNTPGGQVSLDGSGSDAGMTYAWTTGTGNIVSGSGTNTAVVDAAGTYTITVTNSTNGCSATDDAVVTEDLTLPVADAGSDFIIDCNTPGGQVSLDGSGSDAGMTYAWTTGTGNIVSGSGTNTAVVDAAGTYTITVTNSTNGCSATDDALVTEDLTAPVANAGSDVIINCNSSGGQEILDGSGSDAGMTYAWMTGAGNVVSGSGTNSATVDAAGTYTITVTNATNGCSATDDVVVTEDLTVPVASAGSDLIIDCSTPGGQVALDGSGSDAGMTYAWTTGTGNIVSGAGTTTPVVDNAGTYTITVTNAANGCSATDDVSVTQDLSLPVASAGSDLIIDCNTPGGQVTLDGSGSDVGMTYAWTTSGGNIVSGSGTNTAIVDAAGTYTITVTNSGTGCSATDNVTVTEDLVVPLADAGVDAIIDCYSVNGQETLDGSGSDAGMTYAWTTGAGNIVSGSGTTTAVVDAAGTYTITVTNATNGCSATDDVVVTEDLVVPVASAGSDVVIDCNSAGGQEILDGSGSDAGMTYVWTTSGGNIVSGSGTNSATVDAAGTYTITVTNATNGCSATDDVVVAEDLVVPLASAGSDAIIDCNSAGGQVSLDGTGSDAGMTYAWTTGTGNIVSGSGTNTAVVDAAGTYTITVTNATNGCSSTDDAVVTEDLVAPIAGAGPDVVIDCNSSGGQEVLDGSGSDAGMTYAWTTGAGNVVSGSGTNSATVDAAGTYTITVTNATNGCSSTDDAIVTTDFATPTASVVSPSQLDCSNPSVVVDGSATLNSSGTTVGLTYSWTASNGGVISGASNGSTITATSAGDYTLIVTQSNGCTDQTTVSVSADASLPSAVITGNADLTCAVTTITLDGSTSTGGTLTYEWQDASNNPIGTNTTYDVTTPGTYYLEVTNTLNSCVNTTSVIVNQDITTPSVVIAAPIDVDCNNPVVQLDGSGSDQGANYTYTWTAGGSGMLLGTSDADTDSTSTADTYTLTVLNTVNGCSDFANVTVAVDTVSPISDAGVDQQISCSSPTVNIDGSTSTGIGLTYFWSGPGVVSGGATSVVTVVNQVGGYELTVTGANGCTDSDSVYVIPNVNVPIADAGIDMVIDCSNPSVLLDGSNSESGANITYSWATPTGNVVSGSGTNQATVDLDGTYGLTVTNTSNGCSAVDSVTVTMDTVSPIADAGSSSAQTITCSSVSVTLDASASSGSGLTYNWTTLTGNVVSGANTVNPDVDAAGTYVLEVMSANGCVNLDSVTITIDTVLPTATVSALGGSLNCNVTSINLDGSASTGSNVTYTWTTVDGNIVSGSSTSTPTVDAAGTYLLTVASDNGCEDTVSVEVVQTPSPVADFTATPTEGQMPLEVVFADSSSGSGLIYSWDFGDGNSDTAVNPINVYEDWGEYVAVLTVTDSAGCISQASTVITVTGLSSLTVPNIFSPNGDGVNDIFNLTGTNIKEISGSIMNRWGQLLYEWETLMSGWDGRTLAGEEAAEGVYYYFITAIGADDKEYKYEGTFELVR